MQLSVQLEALDDDVPRSTWRVSVVHDSFSEVYRVVLDPDSGVSSIALLDDYGAVAMLPEQWYPLRESNDRLEAIVRTVSECEVLELTS
jgi:hypothetical protein